MLVLGIESSCDETSVAIVRDGKEVLSNVINTQIKIHEKFGGVVPEVASRHHVYQITMVFEEAFKVANVKPEDIDLVAVTEGPGLIGSLLVGVNAAKTFALMYNKPIIGVHHLAGHIYANAIEHEMKFPLIALLVSGGNTELIYMKDHFKFEIIGETLDDAVGEAYDKVARVVGIGYPGGPKVDKLAKEGNPDAIEFPKSHFADSPYDFSFSGIKSAVLNYLNSCDMKGIEVNKADVAASFQKAVIEVLTENAVKAAVDFGCERLALAGGVAANSSLREHMRSEAEKAGLSFYNPSLIFCTDNAAMIGVAGYYDYMRGIRDDYSLNAVPNLKIGTR